MVAEQDSLLGRIKVLGRDPSTALPIFTERGISVLGRYGSDHGNTPTSREALRCLANALLLNEASRQTFVDLGYAPKTADRLKIDDRDDEFLASRLLFLLTYNTKLDFEVLFNQHDLADSIHCNVFRHSRNFSTAGRRDSTRAPMTDMALTETMKLMFNITYHYPHLAPAFTPTMEPIINIVLYCKLPQPPLQPPITHLLNALLNLDLASTVETTSSKTKSNPLFPFGKPDVLIDRLTSILYNAILGTPEADLDQAAGTLVTLLRRIYELAEPKMQIHMRATLLPDDKDRDQPLGKGPTLASRLLRLSSSPTLPTLRDNISSLLFELSDKDPTKFVRNIGYGYASGFLMSHNIQIPHNPAKSGFVDESSDRTIGGMSEAGINPVTGQKLAAEEREREAGGRKPTLRAVGSRVLEHDTKSKMTQEEKEKEAERLFVLFERLRATGVVDVQNPIRQAVEEGRFEEVDE